ncbi:hypothetical protein G6F50_014360 [Rhizopus delemar]|uniref:Uncharacterized protein n=1 Tax=Rhizopus delemar TaxID=936053 RepID=A0A9P6Y697_9FUNG|nr:hypothetical protein G6F50_014360 [Rhizopus delemar]
MISCVSRPLLAQALQHGIVLPRRWQPRQNAIAGRQQPLVADRLQQVIHRALLEGVDGVLIVGGPEHHLGTRAQLGQRARHFDATDAGHADVEEGDVRLLLGQLLQRRGAVFAFGHQLQLRPQAAQLLPQRLPQQFLVVSDQCFKRHGCAPCPTAAGSWARRRRWGSWRRAPRRPAHRRSGAGARAGSSGRCRCRWCPGRSQGHRRPRSR